MDLLRDFTLYDQLTDSGHLRKNIDFCIFRLKSIFVNDKICHFKYQF